MSLDFNLATISDVRPKQFSKYLLREQIGRGAYGKVRKCEDTESHQVYACKIIRKSLLKKRKKPSANSSRRSTADPVKVLLREIAIMKKLDHPNVLRLIEAMDDPDKDKLYLVVEYMSGGSVQDLIDSRGALPEEEARQYFRDLICGLDYLHHSGILHRDIKPENMLLGQDKRIKICDFGVAAMFDEDDVMTSTAGTPAFMAPEIITDSQYRGKPADIWACGVTLYYMFFGDCPFIAPTLYSIYDMIQTTRLTIPDTVSEQLSDFLRALIERDPQKRLTMAQIKTHPWVTDSGKDPFPEIARVDLHVSEADIHRAVKLIDKAVMLAHLKVRLARVRRRVSEEVIRKQSFREGSRTSLPNQPLDETGHQDVQSPASERTTSVDLDLQRGDDTYESVLLMEEVVPLPESDGKNHQIAQKLLHSSRSFESPVDSKAQTVSNHGIQSPPVNGHGSVSTTEHISSRSPSISKSVSQRVSLLSNFMKHFGSCWSLSSR